METARYGRMAAGRCVSSSTDMSAVSGNTIIAFLATQELI